MSDDDRSEVEARVRALNAAWPKGEVEGLSEFFAADAVAVYPGGGRIEGREAVVESYHQFLSQAKLEYFEVEGLQVDVSGSTAVTTLSFSVRYSMEAGTFDERGTEVMAWNRGADGWRAMYKTQIPDKS